MTLLGLAARLPNLGRSGLWLDECTTAFRVVDLHTVFTMSDGSPWFYPLTVWATTLFLGESETALRLPSLLAGIALGPIIYYFLARRLPPLQAVFGGLLAVFNPMAIHYSQEARTYSLAMVLATIWLLLLVELLYPTDEQAKNRCKEAAFIVVSPMLALCHMYALFIGVAGLLVTVIRLTHDPKTRKRVLRPVIQAYCLTVVMWTPSALQTVLEFSSKQINAQSNPYAPQFPPDTIVRFAIGTVLTPFGDYSNVTIAAVIVASAAIVLALGLSHRQAFWAVGACYTLSILVLLCAEQFVPTYVTGRYETVFLGIAAIGLAVAVSLVRYKYVRYAIMTAILIFQLSGCWKFWNADVPKSPSDAEAAFIASSNPDLVLTTLPDGWHPQYAIPMAYYLHRRLGMQVPIKEVPRFRDVEWVSPAEYYVDYNELKSIPLEKTLEQLNELIDKHRIIAIIGREDEIKPLQPALGRCRFIKGEYFSGHFARKTAVLILRTPTQ